MSKKCPDCGVDPGNIHREWCDVERCPACGHQSISCVCGSEAKDIPRLEWTGEWPGVMECREFGWYSKFTEEGWKSGCDKDAHGATADLNRLYKEAKWDKDLKRFVKE